MEIKVIGLGCGKCKKTYSIIEKIIRENRLNITLSKVEDIAEMTNYDCYLTPAVAIDGKVVIKEHIPKESEILSIINKLKQM